jgi:hypothetical protein
MTLEEEFNNRMAIWKVEYDEWCMGPDSYRDPKPPHFPIEWQTATCKHCKYKGLVWRQGSDDKWRLYTPNQNLHHCKAGRKAIRKLKRDSPR